MGIRFGGRRACRERLVVLLTGERGVGKSSICLRLASRAREVGLAAAGLVSRAVEADSRRIGLQAVDLASGESWELASTERNLGGPAIGPYSFSRRGLARALRTLRRALRLRPRVLVLDELGPLELHRREGFYGFVATLRDRREPDLLIVVRPSLVDEARAFLGSGSYRVVEATAEGRDELPQQLLEVLLQARDPFDAAASSGVQSKTAGRGGQAPAVRSARVRRRLIGRSVSVGRGGFDRTGGAGMASSSERLKIKIYDAIKSSGELKAGNYISVNVKNIGLPIFGKRIIELTGRAASERDKETIERIARELSEGLEVVSTVRIGRTG